MRSDDAEAHTLFQPLTCTGTQATVTAERSFLAHLQGGCQVPIAAWATVDDGQLRLRGMLSAIDGLTLLRGERWGMLHAPEEVGMELAEELLRRGGDVILRDIYGSARTSTSKTGRPR
jgi:hydroxymethylbilane synthase